MAGALIFGLGIVIGLVLGGIAGYLILLWTFRGMWR